MSQQIEVYDYSDKKIVYLDMLLTIIVSSIILKNTTKMHLAIAIGISAVMGVILFRLFRTKVGYYIITVIFSIVWSLVTGCIAYFFSNKDWVWFIVIGIFAFIVCLGFHGLARRFFANVKEV